MNGRDLLLDTHAAIWWIEASTRLPAACYRAVRRRGFAHVSLASAWGVAIKTSLGKLRLAAPFGATVEASGFAFLSLTLEHATRSTVCSWLRRGSKTSRWSPATAGSPPTP